MRAPSRVRKQPEIFILTFIILRLARRSGARVRPATLGKTAIVAKTLGPVAHDAVETGAPEQWT